MDDSQIDDLELDLDFDLDSDATSVMEAPIDDAITSEPDLSLSEDALDELEDTPSPSEQPVDDDLDLSLDDLEFELDDDATIIADEAETESAAPAEAFDSQATVFAPADDLTGKDDLSELELDFDAVLEDAAAPVGEPAQEPEEPEDIELSLDDDLDLELELDLDEEPVAETEPASQPQEPALDDSIAGLEGDDLVLSDLDTILDEASFEDVDEKAEEELELDLDISDVATDATLPPQPIAEEELKEEELEDLTFELDAEFEDKPISQTEDVADTVMLSDEEDDIDLSDIEQMLEDDSLSAKAADSDAEETALLPDEDFDIDDSEIDLTELEAAIDAVDTDLSDETATIAEEDLELSLASDADADDTDVDIDTDLEIDLEDLQLDDIGDADASIAPPDLEEKIEEIEELDIELDLEMEDKPEVEAAPAPVAAETSEDIEEELDLSDLDNLVMETGGSSTLKPEIIDSGDIQLEFNVEEDESEQEEKLEEHLDTITPESAPPIDATMTMPPPAAEEKPSEPKPAPKKKRKKKKSSKLLVIIFILVLLAAIVFGIRYAVMEMGIEIPYVSEYLNPAPKDPNGIAKLSTLEITSKFIENDKNERLFVITGKVHNAYSEPRAQIRLQGKLYTKGKVLSQSEYVYAGIVISDEELSTTSKADIKHRLSTAPPATKVLPNQNVPFMVVFTDLPTPDQLDEFALEPVKSIAAP